MASLPKLFEKKIWYFIAAPDWLHFTEALAGELDFEEVLQRASQMTHGGAGRGEKKEKTSLSENPESRPQIPESRFQNMESKNCALLLHR